MLLDGKGWLTQDYYNQYLDLKEEIMQLAFSTNEELLHTKITKMKFIIEQLKLHGIKLEELLFLAMNVEVKYE